MTVNIPLKSLGKKDFEQIMQPKLNAFIQTWEPVLKGKNINKDKLVDDMFEMLHGDLTINWIPSTGDRKSQVSSKCVLAITTVVIDCMSIVLQAAGIPEDVSRAIGQEVIEGLSEAELTGLERDIQALEQADSLTDQAKAIFKIFAGVYKVTGIRQILGAIENNLSWEEWVIMGVVITAQITAWVASDGAAAIAEIVILGAFVAQAVTDATTAVKECDLLAA